METLKLTIKKKWFDMILSGEKTEEYREIKPYWEKRLVKSYEKTYHFDHNMRNPYAKKHIIKKPIRVQFFNGGHFSHKLPNFLIELYRVRIGSGKEEWGAEKNKKYFVLELGEILSKDNC